MTTLSLFENSELDFDLGILDSMIKLRHVLMQVRPVHTREPIHPCNDYVQEMSNPRLAATVVRTY
jgi:hypothetical protein